MNTREIAKLVAGNILVLIVLLCAGSLVLQGISHFQKGGDESGALLADKAGFNRNTIRATYPSYGDLDPDFAKAIFTEWAAPDKTYVPFTGWRRTSYAGDTVNIEDEYRTRISTNHQVVDSVWFLGGSTMWGTGADDRNTIPSLYAAISGESVWNLGESGYNSFQGLVYLTQLLAKGLRPRMVVFYSGVNDGLYCNANNHDYPTHSRVEKYEEYIREYQMLKGAKRLSVFAGVKLVLRSVYHLPVINFFAAPYVEMYKNATDKRILGREVPKSLKSDTPFNEFRAKAAYAACDRLPKKRELAARITTETWLLASDMLKSLGIELKIFLQPTSQLAPETLNLDYLIDTDKQRIADTAASDQARYEAIREAWSNTCNARGACDAFHDISKIFHGSRDAIYIDAWHLAPQGNRIVAQRMHEIISDDRE